VTAIHAADGLSRAESEELYAQGVHWTVEEEQE